MTKLTRCSPEIERELHDKEARIRELERANRKLSKRIMRLQHRIHNAAEVLDGGWPTDQQLLAATSPPDSEPAEGEGGGRSFGDAESVFADYSPAAYQGGRIYAMDVFADAEDEIERIRVAGWDAGISGMDRLCDFARAAWKQRQSDDPAQRQDAMLERRDCLESVAEAVRRLPNKWRREARQKGAIIGDPHDIYEWFANELDLAIAEQGEQRMVSVYAVPEGEADGATCFTLHDHPPHGADFLTLFRAAAPQPQEGESDE